MTSCVNCEQNLRGPSAEREGYPAVTDFIVDAPNCPKRITVFEAICTVFGVHFEGNLQDLVMCAACGNVLGGIVRSYIELMNLSKSTADICRIVHQIESWHRLQADSGVIDFSYLAISTGSDNAGSEEYPDQEADTDVKEVYTMDQIGAEFKIKREIKMVPKKRKAYTSLLGEVERNFVETVINKRSRRKSNLPVKIMTKAEIHSSSGDDQEETYVNDELDDDDPVDPEPVEEEWKPNVRRSGRISEARLKERKKRAEAKIRRKKLTVKYAGKISNAKVNTQKASKRMRLMHSANADNVNIEKKLKRKFSIKKEPTDSDQPQQPPVDYFDFEHKEPAPPPKKRYKRSKKTAEEKAFIGCTECPAMFYTRWMHEHHMNYEHLHIVPNECPECGLKYFKEEILRNHVCIPFAQQEEDRRQRPFVCELCGRSMANRGNFSHHNMAHDHGVDSRFKCGQCKLTFKRIENLHKHEQIHTMPKNSWQCDVCGKVFYVKRRLKEHNEIHLEQKRYMCSICGMRFAQQKAMIRHGTIHANLNRYVCPLCGKGFKRKDHLGQHFRSKVHPRELIESVTDRIGPLPIDLFRSKEEAQVQIEASPMDENFQDVAVPQPKPDHVLHEEDESQCQPQPKTSISISPSSHVALDPNQVQVHLPHQQVIVLPMHALAQHQAEFGFSDLLSL